MSAFVAAMSVVDPKQKSEGTPFGTWDGIVNHANSIHAPRVRENCRLGRPPQCRLQTGSAQWEARFGSAEPENHSTARAAPRTRRADDRVRRLRHASPISAWSTQGASSYTRGRRSFRCIAYGPDRLAREVRRCPGGEPSARAARSSQYRRLSPGAPALRLLYECARRHS